MGLLAAAVHPGPAPLEHCVNILKGFLPCFACVSLSNRTRGHNDPEEICLHYKGGGCLPYAYAYHGFRGNQASHFPLIMDSWAYKPYNVKTDRFDTNCAVC